MISEEDKRKFLRFNAFLEGAFQTADGKNGLIMLTNFSKEGVKASVNRNLTPPDLLSIEIWLPGSIVPVFMKGMAVWIRPSIKEWTYQFDAGIRVLEIDVDDKQRIMNYAYEHWRTNKGGA